MSDTSEQPPSATASPPARDIVSKSVLMALFLYPGSGHFGIGQRQRGMFHIVLFTAMTLVVVALGGYGLSRVYGSFTSLSEPSGVTLADWIPFLVSLAITLIYWGLIALDTYMCAKAYERSQS